jgi:hypothetical protein
VFRNPALQKEWKLRQNENWDTIFRANAHEGPILTLGSKPCLKYLVKGVCCTDCTLIKSHCELNPCDVKKTDEFIKSLRGE